ncbi:MAG: glycosyltransferase family 4 protein [Bacillota bacterium]|nr:glycosyltransferase family 4 protein [Bacillota bacterium]
MHIVFYAELSMPFSPLTLRHKPLGGSESALYYLSRSLAQEGQEVTVLNHCGAEAGCYEGVTYFDLHLQEAEWRRRLEEHPPDVLVFFRRFQDLLRRDLPPGPVRLFWAHDHLGTYPERTDQPGKKLTEWALRLGGRIANPRLDVVAAVSRWLAQAFHDYMGTPWEKIFVTQNGIDLAHYRSLEEERQPARLIYTSAPERGLDLLLREIFPRIRRLVPEAELHVYSYRSLDRYQEVPAGAFLHGGLPHRLLAQELARSALHVYPTDFPETSCIAAIEAQAAGTPVVTSRRYALQETVVDGETGILIPGEVGSPSYVEAFVAAVVELLRDERRRRQLGENARRRALEQYGWEKVARSWIDFLSARQRRGG